MTTYSEMGIAPTPAPLVRVSFRRSRISRGHPSTPVPAVVIHFRSAPASIARPMSLTVKSTQNTSAPGIASTQLTVSVYQAISGSDGSRETMGLKRSGRTTFTRQLSGPGVFQAENRALQGLAWRAVRHKEEAPNGDTKRPPIW